MVNKLTLLLGLVVLSAVLSGATRAERLVISEGGTPGAPLVYDGEGTHVDGITIEASHVVVRNYVADRPSAPGIEIEGNDVTVEHITVTSPRGGDGDGIRFFGNDIAILDNVVRGTSNEDGRHADCMQTFSDDTPPSQRVRIEGNRCERVDNMCLMAEGPNDGEGDGEGHASDFTIRDNFCETLEASQTLMFEDVQRATITDNDFAGPTHHAIGLAIGSTGAKVSGNKLNPETECEVGIDESSLEGYEGPPPGCDP